MTTLQPSSLELQATAVLWEKGSSTVRVMREFRAGDTGRRRARLCSGTPLAHGAAAALHSRSSAAFFPPHRSHARPRAFAECVMTGKIGPRSKKLLSPSTCDALPRRGNARKERQTNPK